MTDLELIFSMLGEAAMEFHPRYLLEVPVEGEDGKIVFNRQDGDGNIGERQGYAFSSQGTGQSACLHP